MSRQACPICDCDTDWDTSADDPDCHWCKDCGCAPGMFKPDNIPGGCESHPNATHEQGYGLAGGGCGVYSICNECGAVFDAFQDPEMI